MQMKSFAFLSSLMLCIAWLCGLLLAVNAAIEPLDGRFSFSLSTFDPSGKIAQVDRALIAASLGTPILAVVQEDRILMASPQVLPSPLMEDDGTSRFAPITTRIALGHTGIAADGRALLKAAQRLAIEHAYLYDEDIPIDLFMEEMSLLFQAYTMKEGARPFGATLLVAYVPAGTTKSGKSGDRPLLFRIDPSGSVVGFDDRITLINGRLSPELEASLQSLAQKSEKSPIEDDRRLLARLMEEFLSQKSVGGGINPGKSGSSAARKDQTEEDHGYEKLSGVLLPSAIVVASFASDAGLEVERIKSEATDQLPSQSQ